MGKTILVTGGAGFIGSFLSRKLLSKGYNVVSIDNFDGYYEKKAKDFNLDLVRDFSGQSTAVHDKEIISKINTALTGFTNESVGEEVGSYKFVECDIRDYDSLETVFGENKIDRVMHLAAMAGVPYSLERPKLYYNTNVMGTVHLLELSKIHNIENFVFGSSSSVYGERKNVPFNEGDDVVKPISHYAATKRMMEVSCYTYHHLFGLPVVVARIFGPIYGPLQRPYGMAAQRFMRQVHHGRDITIYGKGNMGRDCTYIDDQVDGLFKCIEHDTDYDILNIGTGKPVKVIDLAKKIVELNGGGNIIFLDKPSTEVSITYANVEKAKKVLNFKAKIDIDTGLKRQYEIFHMMPDWYKDIEG